MSQSTLTTVQSQESLATTAASIPGSNRNRNRSADIKAALEHLNSMGYAPPASVVERTPASGFYSAGKDQQDDSEEDEDHANVMSQPSSETQADVPPSPDEDKNISGALLHMSTVYHYVPPDSILDRKSTLSHSNKRA